MGMPATHTDWTVDMVDALPDDGQRYEIIDGELFVTPAPAEGHQLIVGVLHAPLHVYLAGHGIGRASHPQMCVAAIVGGIARRQSARGFCISSF